jgi:hypothetical protein
MGEALISLKRQDLEKEDFHAAELPRKCHNNYRQFHSLDGGLGHG